jgi:hypothetical protein
MGRRRGGADGGYTAALVSWYHDGTYIEPDGKGDPDYVPYVMALEIIAGGVYRDVFRGKAEGAETLEGDPITLCLPEMGIWLYFYNNSPWCIFTTPARSIGQDSATRTIRTS